MRKTLFLFATLLGLALPVLAHGNDDGHMMSYGGGILMWLIFAVIAAVVVYLVVQSTRSRDHDRSSGESALDILKKRYARGEISKEEFEEKKAHLQQ